MIKKIVNQIYPFLFIILTWEVLVHFNLINSSFFPSPFSIIEYSLLHVFGEDNFLLVNYLDSIQRLFLGAIFSIPLALCLSIFIFINKYAYSFLSPLVNFCYPIPKLAIYPLLLYLFGIGDFSKILIIGLGIFFLTTFNTLLGFAGIKSRGYLTSVDIYKIPKKSVIFNILLKGSYLEILEGIKLGLGYGLVMIVASEFTVSQNGIGHVMWNAWDQFRIIDVYAGLLILSLTGVCIFSFFDKLKIILTAKFYGK